MDVRTKMGIAVGGVVVAGAIGWVAGRSIQSPDEAAANTNAPTASAITVAVEKRALSTELVLRGDVGYSEPFDVNLGVSSTGGSAGSAFVTRVPEMGSEVTEGAAILQVSGRPVIALQGMVPMYRDLKVGSTGLDVQELETALDRLGFAPGTVDETFDTATAGAVTRLYVNAGSTPPVPSDELRTQLRTAQAAVTSAENVLRDAQRAALTGSTKASEIAQAQQAVTDAQDGETQARAQAARDIHTARDSAADATTARDEANRILTKLKTSLATAIGGTNPQTGLAPTTPEEVAVLNTMKSDLTDQVAAAQIVYDKAVREAQRATDAILTVQAAGDAAVRKADAGVNLAKTQLSETLDPARNLSSKSAVTDAQTQVVQAVQALGEVSKNAGVTVPASEIAMIPSLPGRLDASKAVLGKAPENPIVTVSGTKLAVESSVRTTERKYVKVGMKITAEASDLNITVGGTIAEIDAKAGGHEVGESNVWMAITLDTIPDGLSGASVKITLPVSSTRGAVLAVPLAALSIDSGGSARVELRDGRNQPVFVPVTVGLVAQGFAEISPRSGSRLKKGDLVVVGTKGASAVSKRLSGS